MTSPDDAVGAIAYVLYKRDKIAFIEATASAHSREPSVDEMKVFHTQSCVPTKIEAYRAQANQLGEAFLNAGLARKMQDFEDEVRESVLSQSVAAVLSELQAKKTLLAWVRDIAGNLGVNVATIIVIGALLGGYQALAKFNANVEKIANVPTATAQTTTTPPDPATPAVRPSAASASQ